MTIQKSKMPMWLVERVAQDELEDREVREIRERLTAEGRQLDDELAAIRKSDREILADLPRDAMVEAIRRRAEKTAPPPKRAGWRPMVLVAPTVLAGGLALAVVMFRGNGEKIARPSAELQAENPEEIGIKGELPASPRLLVYRQKPGRPGGMVGSERVLDGGHAARGDLLQLAYDKAPERSYGVLISLDGARRVTLHLPEEGARTSASLTSVREIRLPSAYELDDAPDFERFVLVSSARPFPVEMVLDAARALAKQGTPAETLPIPLGPDFLQTSVLLHKTGKGAP